MSDGFFFCTEYKYTYSIKYCAPTSNKSSLTQILRKILRNGPEGMIVISFGVFLDADSESPP